MDVQEAYERRVWRLALLLTDDSAAAGEILAEVVGLYPELAKVGDSRLERSVVQSARVWTEEGERTGQPLEGAVKMDEATKGLWNAVRGLGVQPREAWVFREIEGLDPVRTARALDCSRTALETVHLPAARGAIEITVNEGLAEAMASLVGAIESLDAGPALDAARAARRHAIKRRRLVSGIGLTILLVCFGLLLFVLIDLLGWDELHDVQGENFTPYSNLIEEGQGTGDE